MNNNSDPQHALARELADILVERGWKIAVAESCTGGLVCATLTDLAGSSDWFERGYITYSNKAKTECLEVSAKTIESFGAVSEQVAKAMAEGSRQNANAHVAISITGIAGPTGGSPEKLVGTVCFGWTIKESITGDIGNTTTLTKHFNGNRQKIREQARDYALTKLIQLLQ